ncbi:hypothetical protein RJT34_01570 [Clitoria ternatea]|uniref:Uncharacterized protein n=1 Tax=Clitoria ternatea TaxID=43366 RepID=A0AAN9KJH3_CLITE
MGAACGENRVKERQCVRPFTHVPAAELEATPWSITIVLNVVLCGEAFTHMAERVERNWAATVERKWKTRDIL